MGFVLDALRPVQPHFPACTTGAISLLLLRYLICSGPFSFLCYASQNGMSMGDLILFHPALSMVLQESCFSQGVSSWSPGPKLQSSGFGMAEAAKIPKSFHL